MYPVSAKPMVPMPSCRQHHPWPFPGVPGRTDRTSQVFDPVKPLRAPPHAQVATIIEVAPDAVVMIDGEQRIALLDHSAERPFGYARDEVLEDRDNTLQYVQRALASGQPFRYDERIVRPDGSVRQLRTVGQVDLDDHSAARRLVGVCQDVTEQREAQATARELIREQASRAVAQEAERRMRFLAAASAELASSLDFLTTLRTVARLAVPVLADWCAVDLLDESGVVERVAVEHADPGRVRLARELQQRYPPRTDVPFGLHHVMRTGQSELGSRISDEMLQAAAQDEEHLHILRELGLRSYITAPLLATPPAGEPLAA
jgi:PAS domain S-box-containing protein